YSSSNLMAISLFAFHKPIVVRFAKPRGTAKLRKNQRWCGPHDIRRHALSRDRNTCQRCGYMDVDDKPSPRAPPSSTTRRVQGHPGAVLLPVSTRGMVAAGR
ncbi:hypothetical protein, partial [Allomesorhizobium camelthorni]|uniref:hypothetical protein n=1 Tax=Allomesorhizobium camelthorni TaxID=475069 RepID=UPI0019807686